MSAVVRLMRPAGLAALVVIGLLLALGALSADGVPGKWQEIGFAAAVWMVLAAALNLSLASTGKMLICTAVFYGEGVYTYSILSTRSGFEPGLALLAAVILAGACGAVIGFGFAHLRGHYFAIASLAVNLLFSNLLLALNSLTGGPAGIVAVPELTLFGHGTGDSGVAVGILLIALAVGIGLLALLRRRAFGHILRAAQQNPLLVQSWGVEVRPYTTAVFALTGALAGFAGALYVSNTSVAVPSLFTLSASFQALVFVVAGGIGSLLGPPIVAAILIGGGDALNFNGSWQLVGYGAILVLLMLFLPDGVAGAVRRAGGLIASKVQRT
jgi:branched-chain amino acid transport system permease protein